MKEEDAKFYFVETLAAVVHLHRKGNFLIRFRNRLQGYKAREYHD